MPARSRAASSGPTGSRVTVTSNFGMPRDFGSACEETWVTAPVEPQPAKGVAGDRHLLSGPELHHVRLVHLDIGRHAREVADLESGPARSSPRIADRKALAGRGSRRAPRTRNRRTRTVSCRQRFRSAACNARAPMASSASRASFERRLAALGARLREFLLGRREVEFLAPELALRILVLGGGDQPFPEQEAALVDRRAPASPCRAGPW